MSLCRPTAPRPFRPGARARRARRAAHQGSHRQRRPGVGDERPRALAAEVREWSKDEGRRRQRADDLFKALTEGSFSFWEHVHPLFLDRDLTRHDLRELVKRGLAATRGNYQAVVRLFGMADSDYKRFLNIIKRPNGIFLVTGPTGSGKTTTLYSALNELNRPDRKIITAEDPVEYYLAGVNQCEVRESIGMTFQSIIRAMLRQAPNVILVGEMRDQETAGMGIQASLTGHLVFSTLHTNDAPSAITRLVDMGVPSYLVASSVIAIMASRVSSFINPGVVKSRGGGERKVAASVRASPE